MSIYKYVHEDRVDILENLLIRFTQPQEFNDPFEVSPFIETFISVDEMLEYFDIDNPDFIKEYKKNLPYELYNKISDEDFVKILKLNEKNINKMLVEVLSNIIQSTSIAFNQTLPIFFNDNLGILCLCSNPAEIKMWGQYANNYKGFVIVFNEKHDYFQKQTKTNFNTAGLKKVIYSKVRPIIQKIDELEETSIFYTKSKVWKYESEYRILRPLSEASNIVGNNYLFELPSDCIEGVIFGHRTSKATIDKVINAFEINDIKKRIFTIIKPDKKYYRLDLNNFN